MKRATLMLYFSKFRKIISIHALVKRATICRNIFYVTVNISIHALVKRATSQGKHCNY